VRALLTDEQVMLKETVLSLATAHGMVNPGDLSTIDRGRTWQDLADSGILALRSTETDAAASGVEVALVTEALASALVPVPYLGSAVMAAELLRLAEAPPDWTQGLDDGQRRAGVLLDPALGALALLERAPQAVAFDAEGADFVLCLGGTSAHPELVRLDIDAFERVNAADLTRGVLRMTGTPRAEASLALGDNVIDQWLALCLVGASADIVGAMDGSLHRFVEYSKARVQFGVPIGSFQAVQHMCAEALISTEAARSVTTYAAWAVDELDAGEALLAARTAKAYASRTARTVCETMMQCYGGIGQTWENIAHFYLRRALTSRELFGNEEVQLAEIADFRLRRA